VSVLTASTAVARPAERHRVLGDASRGTKARVTLRWPSGGHCRGGGQCHTELSVRKVHSTWYILRTVQYSRSACRQLGLWTVPATVPVPVPGPLNETKQYQGTTVRLSYSVQSVCWRSRASRHEEVPPPEPGARSQDQRPCRPGRRSDGAITIHYCAMGGRAP
jgi:hypothetical protein